MKSDYDVKNGFIDHQIPEWLTIKQTTKVICKVSYAKLYILDTCKYLNPGERWSVSIGTA
jgi:hypothetical protein